MLTFIANADVLTSREITLVSVLMAGIIALWVAFLTERIMVGVTVRRREAEIRADLDAERAENAALRKENRDLLVTARNSATAAQVLSDKVQALQSR
jgi:hypothetical protein